MSQEPDEASAPSTSTGGPAPLRQSNAVNLEPSGKVESTVSEQTSSVKAAKAVSEQTSSVKAAKAGLTTHHAQCPHLT